MGLIVLPTKTTHDAMCLKYGLSNILLVTKESTTE